MLYSINWPNFIVCLPLLLEILGNVCIVIICCPACDIISSGNILFWKEGMSLHHYTFFKKNKDVLVKSVYFTAIYRCDQDMIARLNIADVVLKEYKKDESSVSMLAVIMRVSYQKP